MAIDAGWDPELGLPALDPPPWEPEEPAWEPPTEEELARWAAEDAAAPEPVCPWFDGEFDEPVETDEPAEPVWAVPGLSLEDATEEGLSAESAALLAEAAGAVRAMRLAGARLYRGITAIRRSEVLSETGYRRLSRLLEDHLRLDAKAVTALERQADALHPTVTPTGATTSPDLPATAGVVDDGLVDDDHVEIIRTTMQRLDGVPELDDAVRAVAEEQLAALAATHSPRALSAAAKVIADRLDPDGAAPKDDQPAGNELHYTKRRNGQLSAKLVLRDPAAAALFDTAIRAATPAPQSASTADPDTGLPPRSDDGRQVGMDPRHEARDSKPTRQANGLLDLIAASHRAGLDHPESEQGQDSPTASMPLPDIDDHGDTTAWPTVPEPNTDADAAGAAGDGESATGESATGESATDESATDESATDESATDESATDESATDESATDDEHSGLEDGPPADPGSLFDPEAPEHVPWMPPDLSGMALPGRERVTLTVTLDYETLRQQLTDTSQALALLGDSTWIRPDTARRLACDADIVPVVLGSKGEVLDVGRKSRGIPTGIARAVTARDRHCAFPGCSRRARHSEIHHIIHWAHGGDTALDNLVCLCRYHHDLVHHHGWDVQMIDHLPWFRPPKWLDPTQRLRHNRPWQIPLA